MKTITWILEPNIVPEVHTRLRRSATALGHEVIEWDDEWPGNWPGLGASNVLFHGSLGTAATIKAEGPWGPGAYCATEAFCCTAWYPAASEWLLHRKWLTTTVQDLVDEPAVAFGHFGDPEALFVRPDSPLKPFSGRVLGREGVNLKALDHGFYFEDTSIPIILAPVRSVANEWRYVVVNGEVVAGSAYAASSRSATPDDPGGEPWKFASKVAANLPSPEPVYVLDICSSDGKLWLLELNPFSGADLYSCDSDAVVGAIHSLLIGG